MWPATPSSKPNLPNRRNEAARRSLQVLPLGATSSNWGNVNCRGAMAANLLVEGQRRGVEQVEPPLLGGGAQLGGHLAEPDDHRVQLGDAGDHLPVVAVGPERAAGVAADPPVQAVVPAVVRVSGADRAGSVDPALGQESTTLPQPVAQVQQPEPREVACGGVQVRRADERAHLVESQLHRTHAERLEQRLGEQRFGGGAAFVRVRARAEQVHQMANHDVGGAARVVEGRTDRVLERQRGRVAATWAPLP
jgi:hypothetical protein